MGRGVASATVILRASCQEMDAEDGMSKQDWNTLRSQNRQYIKQIIPRKLRASKSDLRGGFEINSFHTS